MRKAFWYAIHICKNVGACVSLCVHIEFLVGVIFCVCVFFPLIQSSAFLSLWMCDCIYEIWIKWVNLRIYVIWRKTLLLCLSLCSNEKLRHFSSITPFASARFHLIDMHTCLHICTYIMSSMLLRMHIFATSYIPSLCHIIFRIW